MHEWTFRTLPEFKLSGTKTKLPGHYAQSQGFQSWHADLPPTQSDRNARILARENTSEKLSTLHGKQRPETDIVPLSLRIIKRRNI